MGKKKKKNFDDQDFADNTTDEEGTNGNPGQQSGSQSDHSCPHVNKAVNVASLKKALKPAFLRIGACGACSRDKRASNANQTLG